MIHPRTPSIAFFVIALALVCPAKAMVADTSQTLMATPEVLVLSPGETATLPLSVVDSEGPVSGALSFSGFDTSLVSVSTDGFVTGKAVDANGKGTVIYVQVGDTFLDRPVVVRLFPTARSWTFVRAESEHNILVYPDSIDSISLTGMLSDFDLLNVLDNAHEIMADMLSTDPLLGAKQLITIEPQIEGPETICSNFDNHFRLSWPVNSASDMRNCVVSDYDLPFSPNWDLIIHEIGHGYQSESPIFTRGINIETTMFYEAIADLLFFGVADRIMNRTVQHPVNRRAYLSLQDALFKRMNIYEERADQWVTDGARPETLDRFVVLGLATHQMDLRPEEFYDRFFYLFSPEHESLLEPILQQRESLGADGSSTFFVALLSATVKQDLSGLFGDDYGFVVDESLFAAAYSAFDSILSGSIFSGIDLVDTVPTAFALSQNYPNPFNPSTTISFAILESGQASVTVYDVAGRQVAELANEFLSAGTYKIDWNASNLPSGTYYYTLTSGGYSITKPLTLAK